MATNKPKMNTLYHKLRALNELEYETVTLFDGEKAYQRTFYKLEDVHRLNRLYKAWLPLQNKMDKDPEFLAEVLDVVTDKTNRHPRQAKELYDLVGDYLTFLEVEECLKNNHVSYCPGNAVSVRKVLEKKSYDKSGRRWKTWFSLDELRDPKRLMMLVEMKRHSRKK